MAAVPFLGGAGAFAQSAQQAGSGRRAALIIRQHQPENLEFNFSKLEGYLTPNEIFYIRSHFAVPKLEKSSWKLKVEGAVEKPFEIGFDELQKMKQSTLPVTLECAGNSRVFLVPQAAGVQWEMGAVSTAEWTGVPLAALLERAGIRSGAVEVVLEGADGGELRNDPKPGGRVSFHRSIPIEKARQSEVLLAYKMNGADLPPSHGAPVRALVPGYYGMSSVKWITGIRVVTEPFKGYWQTVDYAVWDRSRGYPERRALQEMTVKSLIARPSLHDVVQAGSSQRIFGAAWSGNAEVAKVEISTDDGKSWSQARLLDKPTQFAWRRFEYDWKVPSQKGRTVVMSRATDSKGNVQPSKHDPDTGSYVIHHTLPVPVEIA